MSPHLPKRRSVSEELALVWKAAFGSPDASGLAVVTISSVEAAVNARLAAAAKELGVDPPPYVVARIDGGGRIVLEYHPSVKPIAVEVRQVR